MLNLNSTLTDFYEKTRDKRKLLEDLLFMLKEWKEYESAYAQGLEKIFNRLVTNDDKTGIIKNFHSFFGMISERSKGFASRIDKEIIQELDEFIRESSANMKYELVKALQAGEIMEGKFIKADNDAKSYYETIAAFESISKELSNQKRNSQKKVFKKVTKAHKKVGESHKTYRYSQMKFNAYTKFFRQKVAKTFSAFNEFELNSIEKIDQSMKILKDCISTKILFQEDLNSEIFNFKLDLTEFTIEDLIIPEVTIEKYVNSRSLTLPSTVSILGGEVIESFQELAEKKCKNEFVVLLEKAWQGDKISNEDYNSFINQVKEVTGRKAFLFYLNSKRNSAEFCIQPSGFIFMGQLILEVLNQCEQLQDIAITKNLILLTQTFYYVGENEQKVFLLQAVRGHSLWKDLEFWEIFIDNGIFNEIRKQKLKNVEKDAKVEEENCKSLIFCQLISFGTIMVEFGVDMEKVLGILKRFADKHRFSKDDVEGMNLAIRSVPSDGV